MFYTFDSSGNVSQRLDKSGSVVSLDLCDAYGSLQTVASTPDVFGYGGQWGYYTDSETGLVLCTHRYYDPANGRWLTRDPMGYDGGVNLYGYCGNDPVSEADPDGTDPGGGGIDDSTGASIDTGYGGWNTGIVATVFGGSHDPNKSAYNGKPIRDSTLGASLPYKWGDYRGPHRPRRWAGHRLPGICLEITDSTTGKSVTVPIVDFGPFFFDDPYWLYPRRPRAEDPTTHRHPGNHAGIDLTPCTAAALGVDGKGKVNWRFAPCPHH